MHVLVCALLVAIQTSHDEFNGQLALIRDGHLQLRESIRSIEAHFTVDSTEYRENEETGEVIHMGWWQEGGRQRMRSMPLRPEGKVNAWGEYVGRDTLIDGNVQRTLLTIDTNKNPEFQAVIGPSDDAEAAWCNFWARSLFVLIDSPMTWVSDAIALPENVKGVKTEQLGDVEVYRVDVASDTLGQGSIWFDPAKNFLVRKIAVSYPRNPNFAGFEKEAIDFQEPKPGIWLAKTVEMRVFKRNPTTPDQKVLWRKHVTVFEEMVVNEPLNAAAFVLSFPEGTQVRDLLEGTRYFWGKDAPASPPVPIEDLPVPSTGIENRPRGDKVRFLLLVNGVVLAFAIAAYFLWNRKRS